MSSEKEKVMCERHTPYVQMQTSSILLCHVDIETNKVDTHDNTVIVQKYNDLL
jgi:hypothetical protein